MTEVEKLRALLAEARRELQVLASYVDDPETKWPNVGLKTTAKAHKRVVQRIDAALAEPYHVPLDKRCTRAGCGAEADTTNHWTPGYDYLDERNIKHYAPCPLTKDAP